MNTRDSKSYFAEVASKWDSIRESYFSEAVREAAISKAYLNKEMHVADIGGGAGFITAVLAPLVTKVYLIDNSIEMLEVAKKNLKQFDNVELHLAEQLTLPFDDYCMDAVFANMYLHHIKTPLQAIKEMKRVLRPSGRLVITDLDVHSHQWMKEEMADVWLGFERTHIKEWYRQADLVNIIIDSTDQACSATSQKESSSGKPGEISKVGIFVAVGSCRLKGVEQIIESRYGEIAEKGSSCCSPQIEGSASSCCQPSSEIEVIPLESLVTGQEVQIPQEVADFSLGCGTPTQKAGLQLGEIVLDVGSGGGLDAILAAQIVGTEGRVIGVDLTPAMIERARQSATKAGMTNIEYRYGSADQLPIEDASVDVVISNCVVNLCADKGAVFNEIYRVLRPGGRLQISDIVTNTSMPRKLINDAQSWAACVSGALPEKEYLDLIQQAGLTLTSIQRSSNAFEDHGVKAYSLDVGAGKS